jgi:hypothetical protein
MGLNVAIITKHGDWSASTRFRAQQYAGRIAERLDGGVDVLLANDRPRRRPGRVGQLLYFSDHGRRYVERYRELARCLSAYDAIFVQRGLYAVGPGTIARTVERFDGRVLFDLDDDVYTDTPSSRGKGPAARWLYGPQQARRIFERADAVVVSTDVLADRLSATSRPLTVLPTVPDVTVYEQSTGGGTPGLVGWAGTNGGLPYLDPLTPVFARLAAEGTGRLRVVSSAPWSGPSEFRAWRLEDEPHLFAPFAVGIMPLPDTEYARAKAGFKLLQYMASAVPFVASPVGVNRELAERSGGGLLAETPDEWDAALRALLSEPSLRERMGASGRAFVEGFADLDAQADTLVGLLRGDRTPPRVTGAASSSDLKEPR